MTVHIPDHDRRRRDMSFYISLYNRYASERLWAVFEQIAYTGFSLLVLIVALSRYQPEVSASNLALVALLNLPVPFHAIQLGWRTEREDSIWFGSGITQGVLVLITTISMVVFAFLSSIPITPLTLVLMTLGGFSAVWSNGIRWIFIKLGKFSMLSLSSLAVVLAFLLLEWSSLFPEHISIFASVVTAKICFTIFLIWRSLADKAVSISGSGEHRFIDLKTTMLALARFTRTNGVFTVVAAFAPNAAIAGRIVQQAVAFCRVFQNPLANHTFFHQKTFFSAAIRIQIIFGALSAAAFFFAQGLFLESQYSIIAPLAIFSSTLGFVGIFILRYYGSKSIGMMSELVSAIIFLATALIFAHQGGFLIGLTISECLLFAAGAIVAKSGKVARP